MAGTQCSSSHSHVCRKGAGEVRKVTGKPLVLLVYFCHAFQTEARSQAFNLQEVFHGELSPLIAVLFTARAMQSLLLHAL